jgi:hypothetical protein
VFVGVGVGLKPGVNVGVIDGVGVGVRYVIQGSISNLSQLFASTIIIITAGALLNNAGSVV